MTDLPSEPSVGPRLRDYLDAELDRADRDFFPSVPRPEQRPASRLPAGIALAVVAVVVTLFVLPRLLPATPVGPGAIQVGMVPGSSPEPLGSSAPTAGPGESAAPTPVVSTAPSSDPVVDCGQLVVAACEQAIALARVGHESELAATSRIVADDSCAPAPVMCDRLYPFDSIVVFVTAGADTTGWYSFHVTGLEYSVPTKAEPWLSDLPPRAVQRLISPSSPDPRGSAPASGALPPAPSGG